MSRVAFAFPRVIIETVGKEITIERIPVTVIIADKGRTTKCRAEISIRGNSTAKYPKKPYRLELQDENGDDLKSPLLGMPKESDCCLTKCGLGCDPLGRNYPPYFCPNGRFEGSFFEQWDRIPPDCWEGLDPDDERPPRPRDDYP
jgi:hypothetical protein